MRKLFTTTVLAVAVSIASAGTMELKQHTIGSGGRVVSDGSITSNVTIGQPVI